MNNNIKFFTPVRYCEPKTFSQRIHDRIEGYFDFGGKYYLISGKIVNNSQEVVIKNSEQKKGNDQSKRNQVLEIARKISYLVVLFPLLILKAAFRATHKFHVAPERQTPIDQLPVTPSPSSPQSTEEPQTQSMEKDGISASPAFSSLVRRYHSNADQLSFWDHYSRPYCKALDDKKWNSKIAGLRFLYEEFQGIHESLKTLLDDIKAMRKQTEIDYQEDSGSISTMEAFARELLKKTKKTLDTILEKIKNKVEQDAPIDVKGFRNAGNTCYINSALQPLLAISNFEGLVPEETPREPAYSFAQRDAILKSFKSFLQAWKAKKSPNELGNKIGMLRRQIFEAGLLEGGFVNKNKEKNFQDAGQFFELILHVLGRGFQLEMTKTPVMDDDTVINHLKCIEKTPQGIFNLKLPGESLQEIINRHRGALDQRFDPGNEWRVKHPETQEEMLLSRYQEMEKIEDPAPEILVVSVNPPHVVNPEQDRCINFAALFKNPPENSEYELVGFSQNHYQVHWTSVVYDKQKWQFCNDDDVQPINTEDRRFKHPANYMIYKKKA